MVESLLISLSGRPGSGKSTIARALARELGALWLRIDSIEQAIRDAGVLRNEIDAAGYLAAQAVAADNLHLGRIVIADCVNAWAPGRDAWRETGARAGASVLEVQIVCSDEDEHRRRVETRETEVPGLELPNWQKTSARVYDPWDRERLVIETAGVSVNANVQTILDAVRGIFAPASGKGGTPPHSPGANNAARPESSTAPR